MKTILKVSLACTAAIVFSAASVRAADLKISLLNAFVQDEFWQGCSVGAARAAKDVGATLTELDGNNLAQTQVNQIDVTLQQAPDAMLIASLDSNAVVPQLKKAMDQGINVYAFNTAVPNAKITATVAMDEVATGATAADEMVKLLQAKAKSSGQQEFTLLHLVGAVATEAVRLRRDGFNKAIAKPVEGITINMVEVVTDWKPEMAVNGLQDTLTKGKIDAIFTESDFLTPFLVPVLKREGYTEAKGSNHVIIGGLGGIPGGLQAIREGWQDFTLNYPIDGMCSASVHLAAANKAGKPFDQSWEKAAADAGLSANTPKLVDSETSGPSILLTANPITLDKVDSKEFWANTFKD